MLRELTYEELNHVSGGDDDGQGGIIVNGHRVRSGDAGNAVSGLNETGTVFLGGTGQYLAFAATGPQLVDTNEDGVPDSPGIVVTGSNLSQLTHVGGNTYAIWHDVNSATLFQWVSFPIVLIGVIPMFIDPATGLPTTESGYYQNLGVHDVTARTVTQPNTSVSANGTTSSVGVGVTFSFGTTSVTFTPRPTN